VRVKDGNLEELLWRGGQSQAPRCQAKIELPTNKLNLATSVGNLRVPEGAGRSFFVCSGHTPKPSQDWGCQLASRVRPCRMAVSLAIILI